MAGNGKTRKEPKRGRKKRASPQTKGVITSTKVNVWQLKALGYSNSTISQYLNLSESTVKRYYQQVQYEYSDLPSVKAAIDTLATKIPKAIRMADKCLDAGLKRGAGPKTMKIGYDAAKDILNNFKVMTEKHEEDLANQSDADLIREAESIIAGTKRATGEDQRGTETPGN